MTTDPEQAARVLRARRLFALVLACGVLLTITEAVHLPERHHWQHIVGLLLACAFIALGLLAYRRVAHDLERSVQLTYLNLLLTPCLTGIILHQPLGLVGATIAALIVASAPRLLSPHLVDRWVLLAVLGAIVLGAEELLSLPTRLAEGPRADFLYISAFLAIGALTARDFALYPLKSKFTLASLLIALVPMLLTRIDSQRRLSALDTEASLKDISYRTSHAASTWDTFLADHLMRLRVLAGSDALLAACSGDTRALAALDAHLQRLISTADGDQIRGAILWDHAGQPLAAAGPSFPLQGPPQRPIELVSLAHGDDAIILSVPLARPRTPPTGTLAITLRPGLLREWSATAASQGLSVVFRDAQHQPLFSSIDPELIAHVPDPTNAITATSLAVPPPRSLGDDVVTARLNEGRSLVALALIPSADWSLALVRSEHELIAAIDEHTRRLQWITLLVAAIASLGAFLLSQRLAAPIAQLAAAMVRFTEGHTDVRAPFTSADEIGELARRFDLMAAQVGGLVHSLGQQTERLQSEVTERSAQELRLNNLNKQLSAASDKAEAANRAKSTFLAHMSHELRTPLNAIIGYGELLHDQALERQQDDLAHDASHIVRAAQHLLEIINDILVLSKIEAGKSNLSLEEFDAAQVSRELCELVQPMVSAGGNRLTFFADREPARMFSDRLKLRQALLNLLSNAAKFTEKGEIIVKVEHQSIGSLTCLSFSVRDSGPGIPTDALTTLFDPFTQVAYPTVRKQSGTGLGLAITRRLCRQMGGEIDVLSTLGVGSTFTMVIPSVFKGTPDSDSWRPLRPFRGNDDSGKGRL